MLLEGVAEEVSLSSLCLELCYHYRVCVFWCFLIVIGEAAARGERAEGSVATGTPFCRSGLLRSGSAGYCARADMAASESSFRVFAAQL